jgi:hypothetical protein
MSHIGSVEALAAGCKYLGRNQLLSRNSSIQDV